MSHTPIFWVLVAAVAAPLLAEIPVGFSTPVVVLEVVLGILIGPHILGLVCFEGFVAIMFTIGMTTTLFMAGLELDIGEIKGRSLALAAGGWALSAALARHPPLASDLSRMARGLARTGQVLLQARSQRGAAFRPRTLKQSTGR